MRRMCAAGCLRFVTSHDAQIEILPWGPTNGSRGRG
jgi:hypothetical protein